MSAHLVTLGNPNSGKTSLFNALTGARQQVGNWSGVTVDKKVGEFDEAGHTYQLVDLPGINALEGQDGSVDEQITYHYLMRQRPDLVINVVDASCLERSLYLTLQLRELGLPLLVVLNKLDLVQKRGYHLNCDQLSVILGCPVVALSSRNMTQTEALKAEIVKALNTHQHQKPLRIDYGVEVEQAASLMQNYLKSAQPLDPRGVALELLASACNGSPWLDDQLRDAALNCYNKLRVRLDLDLHFADLRYQFIHQFASPCLVAQRALGISTTERLDQLFLSRYFGIPLFLCAMYLMFVFAIDIGSAFIDFFDQTGQLLLVDGVKVVLNVMEAPTWIGIVLGDGVGVGVKTVLTFIPVISCLYLFLAVLESSGYLARAAFVVDRLMRRIGLPGKAFVPMLMGFGCSVPALMSVRTLNSERERLTTSAMIPFMSCGARLPVYALFAVAFFPDSGQNLVFVLYLIGILMAILTGLLLRHTLLPGQSGALIMEMPDYELPRLKDVALKTYQKLKCFVFGAGKTIVLVVALLSVLNSLGTDGSFGHQNSQRSVLSYLSQKITPLFAPLGIEQENWPATVGIVTGIFAKESVVGTLNSLYQEGSSPSLATWTPWERLKTALATIPANLVAIDLTDPMGLSVGTTEDVKQAADQQAVNQSTYAMLQQNFTGGVGAFAYLLFILLYMPCAAAMGALVRETGRNWALMVACWCNGVAYFSATLFYQLANFFAHPLQTLTWLMITLGLIVVVGWGLRKRGVWAPEQVVTQ